MTPALNRSWLPVVALSLLLSPAPEIRAALPGRVEVVDVVRLAQLDRGLVDAGGPSLDVAAGGTGGFGFGPPSCDEAGFSFRPILHPRSGLTVSVPADARHLELILRPTFGTRELSLSLAGGRLVSVQLGGGWQRVVLPVDKKVEGDALLELRFSTTTAPFDEEAGVPAEARALLHRVAFDRRMHEARKGELVSSARASSDVLWLEPGQSVRMPAPLQFGQALETAGVVSRGQSTDLRLHIDLISVYGAVEKVASMPASMDMPWNIDLSRRGERSPVWLRIRCTGTGDGAAGILMPRLTRPAEAAPQRPAADDPKTVVLIAIMGLRYEDAAALSSTMPLGRLHERAWSTSSDPRPSLTSLATGLSPITHGVIGLRDVVPPGTKGLVGPARAAGVHTILRTGFVPMTAGSPIWEDFEDVRFADMRSLKPHAKAVLESTLDAIMHTKGRALALAVLSDGAPPYIPTSDAWKQHIAAGSSPPWPAHESRRAVADLAMGKRPFDDKTRTYLAALRRGKAQEALEQVRIFQAALRAKRSNTLVLVVGLGGTLPGSAGAYEPEDVHVPLWIDSEDRWRLPAEATVDIMDVAITAVAALGALPAWGVQGTDLRSNLPDPWPTAAFATLTRAESRDLAVWGDTVIMANRGNQAKVTIFAREGHGWDAKPAPDRYDGPAFEAARAHLRGWLSAGARWRPDDYEAAVRRGGEDGYADPCRR
jgi:hypothetical protein